MALNKSVERGNFFRFFVHWHLFKKYVLTILVGLPIWYAGGILISQSDVLGLEFTNHKISNIDTGIFFLF